MSYEGRHWANGRDRLECPQDCQKTPCECHKIPCPIPHCDGYYCDNRYSHHGN